MNHNEMFLLKLGEVVLKGLNRRQLEMEGVENIDVNPDCTICLHDRYWSHRYTKGQRGSQAGVIILGREGAGSI